MPVNEDMLNELGLRLAKKVMPHVQMMQSVVDESDLRHLTTHELIAVSIMYASGLAQMIGMPQDTFAKLAESIYPNVEVTKKSADPH